MKKNLLIALSSLTSVLIGTLSTSCSSNPPHNEEDYCDPTLFDCEEENKKEEEEKVELKKYDLTNYEYEKNKLRLENEELREAISRLNAKNKELEEKFVLSLNDDFDLLFK